MRIILAVTLMIGLSSCFKEDEPVPAYKSPEGVFSNMAEVGEFYENQTYFDLETNTFIKTESRLKWDLAFEADENGHFIFLNGSNLMRVIRTGSTNFDSSFTTAGNEWYYDNSNGNTADLALGNWAEESSENLSSKQEVYIIDRGYSPLGESIGMVKFQVLGLVDDVYKIRFSPLKQNQNYVLEIPKNATYNFVHLSFNNSGEVLFAEPPKDEWDLVFTQYTAKVTQITTGIVEDYLVNGVLLNANGVEAVVELAKPFNDINFIDLENNKLLNYRDVIGYDWKDFDFDNNTYSIAENQSYIIKSVEGNYFKLRFTSFLNTDGKRGYPSFEFGKF